MWCSPDTRSNSRGQDTVISEFPIVEREQSCSRSTELDLLQAFTETKNSFRIILSEQSLAQKPMRNSSRSQCSKNLGNIWRLPHTYAIKPPKRLFHPGSS